LVKPGKWDLRFLAMAHLVSTWSKDPSTKVGAVIATDRNRFVSLGYNGRPRGLSDDVSLLENREVKYATTLHAEENAILFAGTNLDGATIYVTHPPCSGCTAKIIQTGIARIVCVAPSADMLARWKDSFELSKSMCDEAGVSTVEVDREVLEGGIVLEP
jgi:dCMP deaminase